MTNRPEFDRIRLADLNLGDLVAHFPQLSGAIQPGPAAVGGTSAGTTGSLGGGATGPTGGSPSGSTTPRIRFDRVQPGDLITADLINRILSALETISDRLDGLDQPKAGKETKEKDTKEGKEKDTKETKEKDTKEGKEKDTKENKEKDIKDAKEKERIDEKIVKEDEKLLREKALEKAVDAKANEAKAADKAVEAKGVEAKAVEAKAADKAVEAKGVEAKAIEAKAADKLRDAIDERVGGIQDRIDANLGVVNRGIEPAGGEEADQPPPNGRSFIREEERPSTNPKALENPENPG